MSRRHKPSNIYLMLQKKKNPAKPLAETNLAIAPCYEMSNMTRHRIFKEIWVVLQKVP